MTLLGHLFLELPGGRPVFTLWADGQQFIWQTDEIQGEDCPGMGAVLVTLNQLAAIRPPSEPGPPGCVLLQEAADLLGGSFTVAAIQDDSPFVTVG